jgi:hypothetical protein
MSFAHRNQAPTHQRDDALRFLGMLADYRDILGWIDVVARNPVEVVRLGVEVVFISCSDAIA